MDADGGHVGLRTCCMRMWMSRKERRKKERKKLTELGGLANGRVGVWTCCVWMRMSRKERRKKKKKNLLNGEGWLTDVLRVDVDMLRADADE